MDQILWEADRNLIRESHLFRYLQWVKKRYKADLKEDYESLYQWSVEENESFWESLWKYFNVISHRSYDQISDGAEMPETRWFLNAKINYAEHVFRNANAEFPALISKSELRPVSETSWEELKTQTAFLQNFFIEAGVDAGDCIAAYLPNIPEATVGFLATNAIGAVWSSCSPDFGVESVLDRFQQIKPKILIAADGYSYNGKPYDRTDAVLQLADRIPSLEKIIVIPYLHEEIVLPEDDRFVLWDNIFEGPIPHLRFTPVDFNHPIWVLYSSGTTGAPKAITHSHGGMLLEHLKYMAFHNEVHKGEKFFWYSTTGWMMWNFVQASLLTGATAVLYDGSAGYPDLNVLWAFAEEIKIDHFGTSAPFIVACMKQQLRPGKKMDLSSIRSIGSTGSPLPEAAFTWIYGEIGKDIWLCSISGGTDVCTAFVGGCIMKPVRAGWIQCRGLGVSMFAFDDEGNKIWNSTGEMVITKPMPAMPIFFWNDPDKSRYKSSYFSDYPGIWRHGDWIEINQEGMLRIYGRSDATLNRHGVRIGTAEIYQVLNRFEEVEDALILNLELRNGDHFMPLFLKMREENHLTETLKKDIKQKLRTTYSPRHVPDQIITVPDIPYTISGKKMEAPVKKILLGQQPGSVLNKDAMRNPASLDFYRKLALNWNFSDDKGTE